MSAPDRGGLASGVAVALIAALVAAIAMLVLDLTFLGVLAKPFYDEALGALRAERVDWVAAALFYTFYIGAVVGVAVLPSKTSSQAAGRGARLGLFAYAVYELTNWAVIAGWPAQLVPVDIAWGVVLTGAVAGSAHRAVASRLPSYDDWMAPSPVRRLAGESWLSVWARRSLSIPLVIGLWFVMVGTLPAWVALGLGLDAVSGSMRRWPKTRAFLFFAWYLTCEALGLLGATVIWSLTLGGRLVSNARYTAYHVALQRRWTDALLFGSVRIFAMRLDVEGAELGAEGPYVTWVRHVSTADTVLTAAVLANPHGVELRYVLKDSLLWDPCLDVVGRRLSNAFVRRGAADARPAIAAVAQLTEGLEAKSAVLIYPEGTRYSSARRARALERLERRADEPLTEIARRLRHTLPPRLGGVLALLEVAPPIDVVTVAHTGLEGARTFREFWSGGLIGQTIRVSVQRISPREVAREARPQWVYERWSEIDAWVDAARTAPTGA